MKVSFRMDSRCSQEHNRREYTTDREAKTDRENIVLMDVPCREAYKTIFDRAINEYNSRQKRKDRQLDYDGAGYYDKILNSKFNQSTKQGNKVREQHPYYECVVQVGNKEERAPESEAVEVLKEYVQEFRERTKGHLVVIGAYIHLDEETPHLHLDYIPVATYNRGMKLQCGLNKAFEQMMNYTSKNAHDTAQMQFQAQEREAFRQICLTKGIEVDRIDHNNSKHMTVAEYKASKVRAEMEHYQQIENIDVEDTSRQSVFQKLTKSDDVILTKEEHNSLLERVRVAEGTTTRVNELEAEKRHLEGTIDKYEAKVMDVQQHNREKAAKVNQRIEEWNYMRSDATQQQAVEQTKELIRIHNERVVEVNQLKHEIDDLERERKVLHQDIKELKAELGDLQITRAEERFINQNYDAFEQFLEEERSRNRGRSR